jgi:multidrug resistance efflux pump
LHWFNPLVWFAAWRLHVESERACDDLVLTNGVRASDYAKHLLHVATNLSSTRMTQACGLAMACPSRLEGRLLAVLNQRANRRRVTRALAFATLTLGLCVVIPVAMLRAEAEKTSSIAEKNTDNQKNTNDDTAESASPAKPLPTGPADAGDNEVNRVKLLHAESEWRRATELRGRNLISETEYHKAMVEMEIARAELAGRQDEVVWLKLRNAETELARVAELQKANLVSKDALDQATYKVALLRAESTGDAAEAARVRFRQAESDFKRASQLHEQKLISEADYNDARQQFEVWRAKLQQDEIDRLTTKSLADETQALLNARFESATKALRTERTKLDNGKSTFEAVYQAARRVRDAEVELSTTPDGQITALTKHVALMRQFEQDAAKRIEVGALAPGDAEALRYWRLTAEIELLRAKRAATATK